MIKQWVSFGLTLALTAANAAPQVLEVTYSDWPPYFDKEKPDLGILPAVFTQAVDALNKNGANYQVEYVYYNKWLPALSSLETGRHPITLGWICSEERMQKFYTTRPIGSTRIAFHHLKTTRMPRSWKSLNELNAFKTVGVTKGYFYSDEAQEWIASGAIQGEWVNSDLINLKKLIKGRINLMILDVDVGNMLIQSEFSRNQAAQIVHHPQLISEDKLRVLISKQFPDSKALSEEIDKGLGLLGIEDDRDQCQFSASTQRSYIRK